MVRPGSALSRRKAMIFAAGTAATGIAVITAIFAATSPTAFEAESGSLGGAATEVSLSGASGGSAVKFGPATTAGKKFVTSTSANGRYFQDQAGQPILIKGDSPWSMFLDMSPSQVELWATNREGHGFNAAIISLIGAVPNGSPSDDGATFDEIRPFNSGNITSFNEAYWSRMDNYMTILKNHGITAFLYPIDGWNTLDAKVFTGKSTADCSTYGRMVATRYASYPNIVWMTGGDYVSDSGTVDAQMKAVLQGIRSAGDTRPFTIQFTMQTQSTDSSAWENLATWNFAYTYIPVYRQVLAGYRRTHQAGDQPGNRDPRPVIMAESNYEGEDNLGGAPTTNETLRRQILWSLTSGAAGDFRGSADWLFYPEWENRLDTVAVTQTQKLHEFISGLAWHQLVPDDLTPVVTAGRGTKITSDAIIDMLDNNYVTAAQTPDKSQTLIYVPTNVGNTNARTITLATSQLPAAYTATWVDPTDTSFTQPATVNASGQVTTPGLHADGTRDWLLFIH